jgi:glycosyltransferase involved in cell wall biosynthesis
MKIGIYNPYLDSLSGGERYMLTIASALQHTYEVHVFWNDKTLREKAENRLSINLSKVQFVPTVFSPGIPIISSFIKTKMYDVIIVLSDGSIPFIASRFGILHFQRPFQQVKGTSFANRLKMRNFQTIICNSKFTKRYIDKEFNVTSQIVYPPVDITSFFPGKKENVIISVGRFHPFKKQDVLIKAFAKFFPDNKNWRLVLVGGLLKNDADYFESLKKEVKNLPVLLYDNSSFNQLKKLLSKSAIYWHAAGFGESEKDHPENFEHFGITIVEAMASGCIPIVFNGGGLPEIIIPGKNGFLWNSIDELIAITKRINSVDTKEKMRKQVLLSSKNFDSDLFEKKILSMITALKTV